MSAPCQYGLCDGDGWLIDELTNTARPCRCRPMRIAQARGRKLSAVIPNRYRDVGFDRYPVNEIDPIETVTSTRSFVGRIEEHLDAGHGLLFAGPVGTGKTALAMLVTKAALAAGRSAARYTLPGLLNEIRRTFENGSTSELLEGLTAVDLLHIDDIGAEQSSGWVLETLYSIVNTRYEERKSIVGTTNLKDPQDLIDQISERTVSRLTEMCDLRMVLGDDRRYEPSAA
jgi:DNA replication protein DnaC